MRQVFFLLPLLALVACKEQDDSTKAKLSTITESVYASITVIPKDAYFAYAAVPGIINEIYFAESDQIEKGNIIAKVNSESTSLNIQNAKLNVDLANEKLSGKSTQLSKLEDEIALAIQTLSIDSLNFVRQESLWKKGIGSKSDFETRKLKFDLSRTNLEGLKNAAYQTRISLDNSLEQANTALKIAKSKLKDFSIKSNIDGMVYSLFKDEGELITNAEPLAYIGAADQYLIEMQVDEVDITKLKTGQSVLINLDAYPDQIFDAQLTKIYPSKIEKTQTFKVEAEFNTPPEVLYAGLSGEANIIQYEKQNVLVLPRSYLKASNIVLTDSGEQKIEIGLMSMEFVEILNGIDSSTIIYKP